MLKGKAIIELTDVDTGEKTVQVEDNIMTNALEAFFNQPGALYSTKSLTHYDSTHGYANLFMYNSWNLSWATAGLVVSNKTLEESPDTLEVPLSSILGAATKQYTPQIADGIFGTYNETESFIDIDNGVFSHVFDFPTSACNGTIRCLSVMHPGGVVGLPYAKYDSFKDNLDIVYRRQYFVGAEIAGRAGAGYRVHPCPGFIRQLDGTTRDTIEGTLIGNFCLSYHNYETSHHTNLEGLKRMERILAFDVTDNSIYTITWTDFNKYVIRKRVSALSAVFTVSPFKLLKEYPEVTVTTQTESKNSYGIACVDKATKKAYYFTAPKNESSTVASGDSIHLFETDLVTGQQRHFDITNSTGESLYLSTSYHKPSSNYYYGSRRQSAIIHNGNMYISPSTEVSSSSASVADIYKWFKIPLNNPSNITVCRPVKDFAVKRYESGNMPRHIQLLDDRYLSIHNSTMSLILNIENNTLYNDYSADNSIVNTTSTSGIYSNYGTILNGGFIPIIGSKHTAATFDYYGNTPSSTYWSTEYFATFMRLDIPMTINNLSSPINKTASQTMKVTYVIREVEPENDDELSGDDITSPDDYTGVPPEVVYPEITDPEES